MVYHDDRYVSGERSLIQGSSEESGLGIIHRGKRVDNKTRDAAISTLNKAVAIGAITPDEHQARVGAAMGAITEEHVQRLTGDLPAGRPPRLLATKNRKAAAAGAWIVASVICSLGVSIGIWNGTAHYTLEAAGTSYSWLAQEHGGFAMFAFISAIILGAASALCAIVTFVGIIDD